VSISIDREYSLVIWCEECLDNSMLVATESEWQEIGHFMQTHHLKCQIITPSQKESAIASPCHTGNVLSVQICVLFVENKR